MRYAKESSSSYSRRHRRADRRRQPMFLTDNVFGFPSLQLMPTVSAVI